MLNITFKFRDRYCAPDDWITCYCTVESVEECIKIYGLEEPDVEYIITDIEEETNNV